MQIEEADKIEMLKKAGNYTDKSYVLWIVADFFYRFYATIEGTIIIGNKDGSMIKVPQTTTHPYPNKCNSQISYNANGDYLYGVPIVFDKIEQILNIRYIYIIWDVYHISEDPTILKKEWYQTIEAHQIIFVPNIGKKVFTFTNKTFYIGDFEYGLKNAQKFESVQRIDYHHDKYNYILQDTQMYVQKDTFNEAFKLFIIPGSSNSQEKNNDILYEALNEFEDNLEDTNYNKQCTLLTKTSKLNAQKLNEIVLTT